jgi:hypothetical protein
MSQLVPADKVFLRFLLNASKNFLTLTNVSKNALFLCVSCWALYTSVNRFGAYNLKAECWVPWNKDDYNVVFLCAMGIFKEHCKIFSG